MKTIDFSYFIERYNAGEMSEVEREWFQKELKSNEQLREEALLRKKSDDILKNKDIISLRKKLQKIESNRQEIKPGEKAKRPVYFYYAAAISILIIVGSAAIFSSFSLTNDEIMDKFYNTYEPPTTQRSGTIGKIDDFELALDYYNTHDYFNAASLFKKVLESNPKNMESKFLYGVSSFENQKYPEAEISFTDVIKDGKSLYIETSKWYLALCYIKTGEKDKALQQLKIVSNDPGIYQKDANKIIRKLR